MLNRQFRTTASAAMAVCLMAAPVAMAGEPNPPEGTQSDTEQVVGPDLPEPVAELAGAMSDVERVEPLENGTFALHRRMQVTGSRLPRDVTLRIAKDGTVLDWGATPMQTRRYVRRELYTTGQIELAEALDQLDPSIHVDGEF